MFDLGFRTESENDIYSRQIQSSAGAAVFFGARADREHWVQVGRAYQRFALQGTALGLKQALVNQPVEVADLRSDLAAFAGFPGRRPHLVMRFGYGPPLPKSPRRPLTQFLPCGTKFTLGTSVFTALRMI
jgi:hypothetical protein